jgi:hypothetical protein
MRSFNISIQSSTSLPVLDPSAGTGGVILHGDAGREAYHEKSAIGTGSSRRLAPPMVVWRYMVFDSRSRCKDPFLHKNPA